MPSQDKPVATIRAALKTILDGQLGAGVKFYDYFPTEGVKEPCVVIQNISGSESEAAVGENVDSGTKGIKVTLVFQFDVYHSQSIGRDEIADKLLNRLWTQRATLKNTHKIERDPSRRIQDVPAAETGERLYRKSIDIPFTITMTQVS